MRRHPISVACTGLAIGLILLSAAACAGRGQSAPQPRDVVSDQVHEDHFSPPPVEDIRAVMEAKLVHTQAIVEGLALGDLEQVRANALRLDEVSGQSAWMVHDTITYIVLSEDFRRLVQRLAENAEEGDMDAVVIDYTALTTSCVNCHTYLQRERAAGQLPGRLTRLNWAGD